MIQEMLRIEIYRSLSRNHIPSVWTVQEQTQFLHSLLPDSDCAGGGIFRQLKELMFQVIRHNSNTKHSYEFCLSIFPTNWAETVRKFNKNRRINKSLPSAKKQNLTFSADCDDGGHWRLIL